MKQKKIMPYVWLTAACIGMAAIVLGLQGKYIFASGVDWLMQHSVFPEYFRQLFYETGEWYPDFAMSLGGGQNIYYFAYYGLLNPQILLSYLFPWIPMEIWMIGMQGVNLTAAVLLYYHWITKRGIGYKTGAASALLFLLSAPLVYHSYVQIMFVNYMPFLLLALIGTDRYFSQGRKGMLLTGTFLMIMTSFYFSIGGLGCLCLYALFCYVELNSKITWKGLCIAAIKYLLVLFGSILLSSFFLVPTAMALLSGRAEGNSSAVDLGALLLPFGNPLRILYSNYGVGLTVLTFFVIAAGMFQREKAPRVLSIALSLVLCFPIVTYLLNGCLYDREKALIPFLPLIHLAVVLYLEKRKENTSVPYGIYAAAAMLFCYFIATRKENLYWGFCMIDFCIVCITWYFFFKKQKVGIVMIPAILTAFLIVGAENKVLDVGVVKEQLGMVQQEEIRSLIEKIPKKETEKYRVECYDTIEQNTRNINRIWTPAQKITSLYSSSYNPFYDHFRKEVFDIEKGNRNILMEGLSQNPIFRELMGVRYVIAKERPVGYQTFFEGEEWNIYENTQVLPLAYGVSQTISESEYQSLTFPYDQLVLREHVVSQNGSKEIPKSIAKIADRIRTVKDQTAFEGSLQGKKEIHFAPPQEDSILMIRFRIRNHRNQDVSVQIGDAYNKLSASSRMYYNKNEVFTYAIGIKAGQDQTTAVFSDGNYEIEDVEMYLVPWNLEQGGGRSTFVPEKEEKKTSQVLKGHLNMKENGYLVTSIPYDTSYQVIVDGQKRQPQMVNEGFLGISLTKGMHKVSIIYHAPGKRLGLALTIMGILLFFFEKMRSLFFMPSKHKQNGNKKLKK